ncbi:Gfo/Idh/MocA family oxidoreductase [Jatrophihabitans telluris]|uniref:Gfo/Idh/MocA family oxidoreductase n=1 Tax=Jatrophihabitans telluris TaxID=2038343 RepID=A0ABY4R2X0_9ACTN|nr:Gfo/Idh/MocA family oxidoreductase [Jatrophihabitans telluris]UQX89827.1 Gfo/Idh/MocA family oxidoreductase [Jatrophihabitans telluris]
MPTPLPDDRPIRWGLLGAGGIAHTVARDIVMTDGNVVAAVAARSAQRASAFASEFAGCRAYGDYEQLVNDDGVDVVYVATTHPHHREHALMAIAAGKPVLIEKPVALTAAHTAEIFEAAKQADVFAMEAMWMRTNPLIRKAEALVDAGAIGDVRGVRAEFGLGLRFDPEHRLYDLANGGGALLDLGVYPVTFGYLFLGQPESVAVTGSLAASGTDETVAMQWRCADGSTAQLWCSAPVSSPNRGAIYGTEGWILTEGQAHRPTGLIVHGRDGVHHIDDPIAGQGSGYGPEIAEVGRCLRTGLSESPLIPHADTIAIMGLLDHARAELGVRYPGE